MGKKRKKNRYYAFDVDGDRGIVESWTECEAKVKGRQARYRGFPDRAPAEAWLDGDYEKAAVLLERALRIEPRDPEILQSMAEVQLQNGDYEQALNFAVRSYDSGPRVGEICSRNWRTIGVAREQLGDSAGAADAVQRASSCMSTRPERL